MKLKNIILIVAICTALLMPSLAGGTELLHKTVEFEVKPISVPESVFKTIHWSQTYVDKLSKEHNAELIFKDRDLNADIAFEDFKSAVQLVIDEEYDNTPDAMTREAVVHELTKILEQKTGQILEKIPVIDMIIYADTEDIDSKYRNSITVAYMKDIAKGKQARLFDPKAHVTLGELAALIYNTQNAIQNELINNESIDEGSFETKASYEIRDDKVVFDFELINHYSEAKWLWFGSGQQFELTITDKKGKEVYRYSDGRFFTMALVYNDINPGESLKWQDEWDMTDKEGQKLTSGNYKAKIDIFVIPEDEKSKIEESQLTATIEFSLNGYFDKK